MGTAVIQGLKPPVKKFLFTESNSIGDLLQTVNALEKSGKPPFLKFIGTRAEIIAVEVLIHDPESQGEMAVAGAEQELPDPAAVACAYCDAIAQHPESVADRPESEWDYLRETGHFPSCPSIPLQGRRADTAGGYPI